MTVQQLLDHLSPVTVRPVLDVCAEPCCRVFKVFHQTHHWSLTHVEHATDLVFHAAATALYDAIAPQAILTVKAEALASFLGKNIIPQLAEDLGSRFNTRRDGACIKHRLGKLSVKMDD